MSVCVCGNVVFDILVRPVEQLRWAATTLVETVSQQLGGNAGSTSYTLAKLGVPTFVVTLTGRDAAAEAVVARLIHLARNCRERDIATFEAALRDVERLNSLP